MSLVFDPKIIEEFFGTPGEMITTEDIHPDIQPPQRTLWIEYAGPTLKYTIYLQLEQETAMISGDTIHPFGGDSMYEFSIPCSAIVAGPDGYHPEQTCLSFFYGGTDMNLHRRMTIMKRPDGELKVWPSLRFPPGHPYEPEARNASEEPR